jgi:predicted secreted protein
MLKLDEHADGTAVTLRAGAELELSLAENPTTGFHWRTRHEPRPVCIPIADHFAPGNRPGEGGRHTWLWKAAQQGTSRLELELRRDRGPATRTFGVTLIVH